MRSLTTQTKRTATLALCLLVGPLLLGTESQAQKQPGETVTTAPVPFPATLTTETAEQVMVRFENTPLPRALDENELQLVTSRILTGSPLDAGSAARFLANAQLNAPAQRLAPIITRFKREVQSPGFPSMPPLAYLSGRIVALNQFLLALANIDQPEVIVALQKERQDDEVPPVLRKWLTLASGYVGDETVADQVKTDLDEEKDLSVRVLLISAYARSAKEKAVPTLEALLEDKTATGEGCFGVLYGIQIRARDELARLRLSKSVPEPGPA